MTDDPGRRRHRDLARARGLARLLDRNFRVPGTSIRFGLDPILGLLPVGGDLLAAVGSGYILYVAWRKGAPTPMIARMLGNVALDTLMGSVPVLGDLFDAAWKANARNMAMLDGWLGEEPTRDRRSKLVLAAVVVVLVLLLVGALAVAWWVISALFDSLGATG